MKQKLNCRFQGWVDKLKNIRWYHLMTGPRLWLSLSWEHTEIINLIYALSKSWETKELWQIQLFCPCKQPSVFQEVVGWWLWKYTHEVSTHKVFSYINCMKVETLLSQKNDLNLDNPEANGAEQGPKSTAESSLPDWERGILSRG